jgi:GNAT superfamily N-acetyltransferase
MAPAQWSAVERLTAEHDVRQFDCGKQSLNDWLKRFALANDRSDASRTYVVHSSSTVVGYYSLAAGSVLKAEAPGRISKGLANHPIPVVLLARLAVDRTTQGAGLGSALLKDALLRVQGAADIVGIRAVLVHAIDKEARAFYARFDFEPCLADDLHLMLLMKDLRENLRVK